MIFDEFIGPIKDHAFAEYPNECVGVITRTGYQRLENVSPDPRHTFDCHDQIVPLIEAGEVLALVHSHPDGPHSPSAYDIAQQMAMDIPFGLISTDHEGFLPLFFWGDMLEPPPLVGRGFRYGPSGTDNRGDCAALVRDWYRIERGVMLREFPREDKWWLKPGVSYRNNLLSTGFAPVDKVAEADLEPQIGDVFLALLRSSLPDHSGIYIGHGRVLHHLADRFSMEDSVVGWSRLITGWYRHTGASPDA